MGIEPLGSAMAFQSQPMQKQADNKPAAEKKDVSVPEKELNVNTDTAPVVKEEKKDGAGTSTDTKEQQQTNERIKKAVEQLNKNMPHSEAVFGIHEKTNRVTIKIIDKDTKELIREYPPEKTLDMIAKVWELAGILVDEKR